MNNPAVVERRDSLIVVPTYNEIANIDNLIKRIDEVCDDRFDILFVDDDSPDGTGERIDDIRLKRADIMVLHRSGKMGLGSAYLDGFQYGVKNGYKYIFEMDADLSHDPAYLRAMTEKLSDFDIVVGSRFMSEFKNINTTPFRILASIIAGMYMRLLLGITCTDPMGGFVGYRRTALEGIDYSGFIARGYAFQAEMKYECKRKGCTITEIPIVFKNRDEGSSKMSKKDIAEALILPWKVLFLKHRG